MLRRLFVHTSAYTIGSLLVTLASFISFPIFTRMFSVSEYGVLNLISATLMLLTGIGKFGVQHSVVRYYGEIRAGKRDVGLKEYYSTVVFGMAATGLVVTLAWAAASQLIPAQWWNDPQVRGLLLLTAVLVFVRVTDSGMANVLRAQQRSTAYSVYSVAKRYAGLGIILVTVFYLVPGLDGFYLGTIAAEGSAIAALFVYLRRYCEFSPSAFSPSLYRAMLAFGIPMIGYELGGVVLSLGDRYVIQLMLGGESLGLYAAAYNLCEYVQMILIASVGQAIVPMYVRLWEEKGEADTQRFVQQSLHFYLLLGAAVVAGLTAVGDELLAFLASEKYRSGASIIPYVVGGMILDGSITIFGAGLYIHKQTRVVMVLMLASAVLNVVLNVLLIPHLGIQGAAIATLISYAFLSGSTLMVSNRRLRVAVPWGMAVKFGVLAIAMYAIVVQVRMPSVTATLVAKIAVGGAFYAILTFVFDRTARDAALAFLGRLRGR